MRRTYFRSAGYCPRRPEVSDGFSPRRRGHRIYTHTARQCIWEDLFKLFRVRLDPENPAGRFSTGRVAVCCAYFEQHNTTRQQQQQQQQLFVMTTTRYYGFCRIVLRRLQRFVANDRQPLWSILAGGRFFVPPTTRLLGNASCKLCQYANFDECHLKCRRRHLSGSCVCFISPPTPFPTRSLWCIIVGQSSPARQVCGLFVHTINLYVYRVFGSWAV